MTVPPIEGGEDVAEKKTDFFNTYSSQKNIIQVEVNLFVHLLGSPPSVMQWLAWPCSVSGLLVWDQVSPPESLPKLKMCWKSSEMLPAAAATVASVPACA